MGLGTPSGMEHAELLIDLTRTAQTVAERLSDIIHQCGGPEAPAERLIAAMRHGAVAGGKRMRPFLVQESAALFDVPADQTLQAAVALELVHCYSLVHDDLPAMDNDDLRRGQPTVHKAFDEATAILAGDGLLTLAFEVMADPLTHSEAAVRADLVLMLARASGVAGMAGGQMLDLRAEGRFADGRALSLRDDEIRQLQAMKTGALIHFACMAGARLGGADERQRQALDRYGRIIGLAFQIADDLIDHEGDAAAAGKATGKDAGLGKGTLVSLNGADWARQELHRLVQEAGDALAPFGTKAERLKAFAAMIAFRKT